MLPTPKKFCSSIWDSLDQIMRQVLLTSSEGLRKECCEGLVAFSLETGVRKLKVDGDGDRRRKSVKSINNDFCV